jgi:hypothetical protein
MTAMKKYIVLLYALLVSALSYAAPKDPIDEKLLRSFKEAFPHAQQVSWRQFTDAYIVNFVENGVRTRISFGKDGEYLGSYRFYGEGNLPLYLVFVLRHDFPGTQIFGVTEVSTPVSVDYYVKMVDARFWTTIKINSDTKWERVEKYRIAN